MLLGAADGTDFLLWLLGLGDATRVVPGGSLGVGEVPRGVCGSDLLRLTWFLGFVALDEMDWICLLEVAIPEPGLCGRCLGLSGCFVLLFVTG